MKLPDKWTSGYVAVLILSVVGVVNVVTGLAASQMVVAKKRHLFLNAQNTATELEQISRYIDTNSTAFENLINTTRAQRRLRWAEIIESAGGDVDLSDLNYEIQAFQMVYDGSNSLVRLGYETSHIEFELAHDGELLAFISYLEKNSFDVFDITFLDISRRSNKESDAPDTSSLLKVNCTVRWYSIEMVGGSDAAV